MFDLAPLTIDINTVLFLVGMIILSFIFYKLSDRLKPHPSWAQYTAGASLLLYAVLGGIYGFLWPALAGIILTFFLYYPVRFLFIIIIDSIQKIDYGVLKIPDEDFRKLDVDSQLSILKIHIRYYRRAIISIQSAKGLALMVFITCLAIFILGLLVLSKIEYLNLLLLLANVILFILLFNITPRTSGVLFNFLGKYVFSPEIIKLSNHYEQQLEQSNYEIKAIEQGYYMATKKQIMNRLKF